MGIKSLSVLDGRYGSVTEPLCEIFSEYGLIKHRVEVEIEWLKFILKDLKLGKIDAASIAALDRIKNDFKPSDAEHVKHIEKTTNHDVKAVEYFIKDRLSLNGLDSIKEWVHFACTSDDINNTSYALMLRKGKKIVVDVLEELIHEVEVKAMEYKSIPMMSRTHGQPATPTTVGKEFINFAWRFSSEVKILKKTLVQAKINGATGNFNAHFFVFPEIDWIQASERFLSSTFGLEPVLFTTQINPNSSLSFILHSMVRAASAIIDFDRDMWGYISLGYFKQHLQKGETGSSTMPHKVNPIDFENSEGNMGLAISIMDHMAVKLQQSRFQRDLSDSTVLRSLGSVFGYYLLGVKNSLRGLGKLLLDPAALSRDLDANPELLAEPFQTAMRVFGEENPYERMKALTRGQKINKKDLYAFVDTLDRVPSNFKDRMKALTVHDYTGLAEQLVDAYFARKQGK